MVCVLTQGDGWILNVRTGCVKFHSPKDVEHEQHFLFSCPAYSDARQKYTNLFQQTFSVSDSFTDPEPNACDDFQRVFFM